MIKTADQLIKRLEAGELMSLTGNSSKLSYELVRANKFGVMDDASKEAVQPVLDSLPPTLRIFTCMLPGCGAAKYLARTDNADALRYEVEIRWVNRPNDPMTFD